MVCPSEQQATNSPSGIGCPRRFNLVSYFTKYTTYQLFRLFKIVFVMLKNCDGSYMFDFVPWGRELMPQMCTKSELDLYTFRFFSPWATSFSTQCEVLCCLCVSLVWPNFFYSCLETLTVVGMDAFVLDEHLHDVWMQLPLV